MKNLRRTNIVGTIGPASESEERLTELDAQLQPLTRERELYKMEQLKIADHKQELASIEEDMFKISYLKLFHFI